MEGIYDCLFGQAVAKSGENTAFLGDGTKGATRLSKPFPVAPGSDRPREGSGRRWNGAQKRSEWLWCGILFKWLIKKENEKLRFLHFSPRCRLMAKDAVGQKQRCDISEGRGLRVVFRLGDG